ncbi:MAG: EAL domain-containing protein [Pseudomonadota bacterium]
MNDHETGGFIGWTTRIMMGLILLGVCAGVVIALLRFELMPSGQALLTGLLIFFSLALLQRQFFIARDVNHLKEQAWDLSTYEQDMDRRMNALKEEAKGDGLGGSGSSPLMELMGERVSALEDRLEKLEADNRSLKKQLAQRPALEPVPMPEPVPRSEPSSEPMPVFAQPMAKTGKEDSLLPEDTEPNAPAIPREQDADAFDLAITQAAQVISSASGPASASGPPAARVHSAATSKKGPSDRVLARREEDRKALKSALTDNRLNLHLQPIVGLPNRSPLYYEAFMKLQDGGSVHMDGRRFLRMAEDGGLMPMIDAKVIFSSVRMLRTLSSMKKKAGLFCNLSPKTLADKRTFNQIIAFLEGNGALAGALVFEVNQSAYGSLRAKEKERLGQIVDRGFSLLLDQVGDLNLDGAALAQKGFRHIKVPASLLLHASQSGHRGAIEPSRLVTAMGEHGISVIGTEVEREAHAVGLIDLDITMGQGHLFAPPRPVKAELLEPSGVEKAQATGSSQTRAPQMAPRAKTTAAGGT